MGRVLSLDGRECLENELSEPFELPPPSSPSRKFPALPSSSLGRLLAEKLLARGAARLIDAARV